MILSHKHKFIFIKTAKTAGSSIEVALSKYCGPKDIIPPLNPEDKTIRKPMGYPRRQHYPAPLSAYNLNDLINLFFYRKIKFAYYHHMSAREIREKIGEHIWNSYYKFCFERNPWDKIISSFYWKSRNKRHYRLQDYLNSNHPEQLRARGWKLYTIDDEIVVDRVCRYENLEQEMEALRQRFHFPEPLELPFAKATFRKNRRNPSEVLNEQQIKNIGVLFKNEIEHFGYTI